MFCPKCGKEIPDGSVFCPACGHRLIEPKGSERAKITPEPAKPAPAKAGESEALRRAKEILVLIKNYILSLPLGEKVIGAAAIVGFVSFFLPWMRATTVGLRGATLTKSISGLDIDDLTGWIWLEPIMMLISLGLVYLAQRVGAVRKIKLSSVQIIIGSSWAAIGILGIAIAQAVSKFFKTMMGYGAYGYTYTPQGVATPGFGLSIGWWLITLCSIAIIVGAFLIQNRLLKGSK